MPNDNAPATRAELIEALTQFEQRLNQRTAEGLAQLEQRTAEALAQLEQRLDQRTAEALAQLEQRLDQRLAERLGRFAETVAAEFSEVREEQGRLRQEVNRHLEIIDRRLDRIGETTAPLTRWADTLDRDNNQIVATQAAQQRAIDDLSARLTRVEQRRQ